MGPHGRAVALDFNAWTDVDVDQEQPGFPHTPVLKVGRWSAPAFWQKRPQLVTPATSQLLMSWVKAWWLLNM